MEKKIRKRGLSNLVDAGSDLQKTTDIINENKAEFSRVNDIHYSFYGNINIVLYLKKLRLSKNLEPNFYYYNESTAVREGIDLLRKAYPNLPQRPKEVVFAGLVGRGKIAGSDVKKIKTSFTISEYDQEFINDFIYSKRQSSGMARFTKEEFFSIMIEHLEKKYKLKDRNL